MTIHLPEYWES